LQIRTAVQDRQNHQTNGPVRPGRVFNQRKPRPPPPIMAQIEVAVITAQCDFAAGLEGSGQLGGRWS
jgi:hypothetical protein